MHARLRLINAPSFLRDLEKLRKDCNSRSLIPRVRRLIGECLLHPREGIGFPELLSGYGPKKVWSRRIGGKHRLVYEICADSVIFFRCYGHYDDH
jgi:toxin YoeB